MLQNVQLYQLELMQRLPPRWPPPVPQTAPWGRPAFVPPLPPPPRGFPAPPRFYPQPPRPATGFYPRVPPRPLVDPEQLWLDSFRRTHCSSEEKFERATKVNAEPPLRLLRRRVVQAQKLTEQLKKEVMELAAVEKRLEDAASSVEAPRLRVQRERKIAACEALKTQLEAMQATSGLFSVKQLAEIRAFAARVDKKKAYRKRAKLRRRVEMSIRRAANAKIPEKVESIDTDKTASEEESKTERQDAEEAADAVYQEGKTVIPSLTPDSGCPEQSLDPETLTLDSLIQVRRAWDSYIVFPQTPGASTIPPHFVPPPPSPSAQWAVYARLS
ncbi:hypothetical protein F441_12592 [Phytophthora nicotianae CJ01A1]|uniref:Uncharacterized protein n=1 Tax=Phytophthora nicotianae CJ01A1 TaxID=1317063 RepID=W2WN64_PHYNI|nr:hypothetical protein F441_12592 [Phytophthora nicotianae CJ01A1]